MLIELGGKLNFIRMQMKRTQLKLNRRLGFKIKIL